MFLCLVFFGLIGNRVNYKVGVSLSFTNLESKEIKKLEKRVSELGRNDITEEWYTQKLDHFNPQSQTTFRQRYFVIYSF